MADVHDFDGIKIGTITRPERFKVEARSSGLVTTTGVFRTSLPQIGLVGLNCLSNELETQVDIRATVDLRLFRGTRRIPFTTNERVPCSVTNIGGGSGAGDARGAPVPASPLAPITRTGGWRGSEGMPAPATPVAPVASAAAPPPPSPVHAAPRAQPPAAPVAEVTAPPPPPPPGRATTTPPPPPAGVGAPPSAGADVPPPEGKPASPAPTLAEQIGNAINEGINNLFGGGR